jgi:hypothetical protein
LIEIRKTLDEYSELIADFEDHLDLGEGQNSQIDSLKKQIREAVVNLTVALRDEA